jgi:hypothetical protein
MTEATLNCRFQVPGSRFQIGENGGGLHVVLRGQVVCILCV